MCSPWGLLMGEASLRKLVVVSRLIYHQFYYQFLQCIWYWTSVTTMIEWKMYSINYLIHLSLIHFQKQFLWTFSMFSLWGIHLDCPEHIIMPINFCQRAPPQRLDWIPNAPPIGRLKVQSTLLEVVEAWSNYMRSYLWWSRNLACGDLNGSYGIKKEWLLVFHGLFWGDWGKGWWGGVI